MARYIDADKAKEKKVYSKARHEYVISVAEIDRQPTADVVEVKHGEWLQDFDGDYYCSACGRYPKKDVDNYCPKCGAKMDGGKAE